MECNQHALRAVRRAKRSTMVQVELDKPKNLLRINYCGHVNAEQAEHGGERMAAVLDGISPGFKLLADLSGLDEMDTACAKHIRKAMDLFNHKGVAQIVRIIPDSSKDIGLNILSLFHYRRGVQIVTFEKLEEAMKVLAG